MAAQQPSYENVSSADDHDETSSGTEVGDSLMADDYLGGKRWHAVDLEDEEEDRPRRRRRTRHTLLQTLARWHWAVDTGLLIVVVGLLLLRRFERGQMAVPARQVGGDFTGAGPEFSTRVVKWEADQTFTPAEPGAFFSNETLDRWNTLMPEGTGWGSPDATFFTTTMTHQLHCIFMMARIYSGVTTSSHPLPDDYHSHFLHCVDYLRQAAMCAADVALEAHEPSDASDNGPLDGGWSGYHVCKDYGEVKHYLEVQIRDGVRTVLPIDD